MHEFSTNNTGLSLANDVPDQQKSREQLLIELEQLRRTVGQMEVLSGRQSEGKYRSAPDSESIMAGVHPDALLDAIPDILKVQDDQYRVIRYNSAGYAFLHLTPEQVNGRKCYQLFGANQPCEVCATRECYRTGKPARVEKYMPMMDAWLDVRAYPILDNNNRVFRVIEHFRDITRRRQAEKDLIRRNKEMAALDAIAQALNQAHSLDEMLNNMLDKTLEILDIRYGAVHLLDKETGRLVMPFYRGATSGDADRYASIPIDEGTVGQVARSGAPLFIDSIPDSMHLFSGPVQADMIRCRLRSAMLVPLQMRGEVLGVMSAATDGERVFSPEERELLLTIGHQVSVAIENNQLLEEASRARALAELDRLRKELLASVSHELRTPLTAIKGLADTLVQPDVEWDRETQREFLGIINRESDVLTHIVEDLVQMSQMEAGILPITKTRTTIEEIIFQLDDELGRLTRDYQLAQHIADGLPEIYVDEMRIGQVITHLVANAASYSEKGTRIVLEAQAMDGQIVVSVADEGIGIPPAHVGQVFDRFYRLESGVARKRGGTGLGLAICKGIVERHDGMIWVESKLQQGSRFSFSLPAAEAPGSYA